MGVHTIEDPRITRSRALILDAASDAFLELGYEGASIDDIAVRARVSKRTVYNIYRDKETLFRATLSRSIGIAERFAARLATASAQLDDAADITALAVRLAQDISTTPVLPLRRLLASEARRFPDLAREYRERAPDAVLRALARLFGALADRGLLEIDDADVAAEHFAFLVMGAELDRGMFSLPPSSAAHVRRRAVAGADAFLRAYRIR